ncbi:conserved hypothetical protein [Tenacibaculum sp. 190524A02b]|uniref:DUF1834 family protein n=1 Tax=Tenacibaculum vairaonense TaxID=3137860 RepID=A0ABP1FI42_9FLAO
MNVRKEVYKIISDKLTTLDTYNTIDLWKAQVNSSEKDPVSYPAAFVAIEAIKWEDLTLNIQQGDLTVNLYLFYNRYGDTFSNAVDKEDSLQILDNMQQTIDAIQWLHKNELFTELSLKKEQDLTERYKRPAFVLTFTAECYNQLKHPNYVY